MHTKHASFYDKITYLRQFFIVDPRPWRRQRDVGHPVDGRLRRDHLLRLAAFLRVFRQHAVHAGAGVDAGQQMDGSVQISRAGHWKV